MYGLSGLFFRKLVRVYRKVACLVPLLPTSLESDTAEQAGETALSRSGNQCGSRRPGSGTLRFLLAGPSSGSVHTEVSDDVRLWRSGSSDGARESESSIPSVLKVLLVTEAWLSVSGAGCLWATCCTKHEDWFSAQPGHMNIWRRQYADPPPARCHLGRR